MIVTRMSLSERLPTKSPSTRQEIREENAMKGATRYLQ